MKEKSSSYLSHIPSRRALKLRCDLSNATLGSNVCPTSRKGTDMFCSGMLNLQNDSTNSAHDELNSNATCYRMNSISECMNTIHNVHYNNKSLYGLISLVKPILDNQ